MVEKKFIRFEVCNPTLLRRYVKVTNHKGEYLGYIEFKGDWKVHKQYVFYPTSDTFYTSGCLKEIINKLEELDKNGGNVRRT